MLRVIPRMTSILCDSWKSTY